jgi:UDP-glucose 6-dehydrogenase
MESAIKIHGELLLNPASQQRATFVIMNLITALQQGNEAVKYASCAYLVSRHPRLIEVHANDHAIR